MLCTPCSGWHLCTVLGMEGDVPARRLACKRCYPRGCSVLHCHTAAQHTWLCMLGVSESSAPSNTTVPGEVETAGLGQSVGQEGWARGLGQRVGRSLRLMLMGTRHSPSSQCVVGLLQRQTQLAFQMSGSSVSTGAGARLLDQRRGHLPPLCG